MKIVPFLFVFTALCGFGSGDLIAQEKPQLEAKLQAEEEAGPMLYKFEPDYLAAEGARRKELLLLRNLIDSLDISESKRQKLIRELYKNKDSKKLTKILLANNKFEEVEE